MDASTNRFCKEFDVSVLRLFGDDIGFFSGFASDDRRIGYFRSLNGDFLEYLHLGAFYRSTGFGELFRRKIVNLVLSGWSGILERKDWFDVLFGIMCETYESLFGISRLRGYYRMKLGLAGKEA